MQSPFQTAPLVKHATDIMRGEFVKELVDTPISAVSVSKVILCPNATGMKQQTDQMTMGHPEKFLKPQLIYNDLQLPPPKLNKCKLPTPIKTDRLKFHLQGYDSEKSLYLLNGFKYGFRLEHNGPRSQFNCSNLKSAKSNPLIVQEKINKEVEQFLKIAPAAQPKPCLVPHQFQLQNFWSKAAEVQVCFRKFKHNVRGMPKTISFSHGTAMESAVVAMVEYLKVRPYSVPTEPLFCSVDATSLHRPDFDRILHKCLASCGLDSSRYKGHSFRIGAATDAAERLIRFTNTLYGTLEV
ncbi:unnamed protein product [Mytilus coruscus]|uniref:Tyr recombinase domain-containing protein n=1 Tax=Mytilus coruscus TaxID=42192 RepID=A0A6J8E0H2_MYTCO|nr:unnamed protein product [Mytilus coruscus]